MTPVQLLDAWETLSDRERLVVEAYIEGLAFEAIGQQFGVSRQRAQQIYSKALRQLGITAEQRRDLSIAHRAIIDARLTGREISAATRAKIGAANRGRTLSVEHKAAIGAAHLGRKASPEARARMSAAQRGRFISPEHRAKLSAAKLGKSRPPFSPEHKARMSAAQKARGARVKEPGGEPEPR